MVVVVVMVGILVVAVVMILAGKDVHMIEGVQWIVVISEKELLLRAVILC